MNNITIPDRNQIPAADQWDLTSLYADTAAWQADLARVSELAAQLAACAGKLAEGETQLLAALDLYSKLQLCAETCGNYAFLLTAGDASDNTNQEMQGRFMSVYAAASEKTSFFIPEIQSIPEKELRGRMETPAFAGYRIWLAKLLRLKPHILSDREERIFALQLEAAETPQKAFSLLTNVDIQYGTVPTSEGELPLSQTTWSAFMENPDRSVRKEAYTRFYRAFEGHKNTIAALYAGSVQQDICQARARGYKSSRQMALFQDDVNESVYDNLVSTIRANLKPLHAYYRLRKKILGLDQPGLDLRHYDVYVPLVANVKKHTPYDQAVETLRQALSPLGSEYVGTLCAGLTGGWVDRYENRGKRSGAFSSGAYTGYPYILMNYKEDVLRDVFTLAHEGGHSMHSWYSARNNPYMHYNYTIFEAEVASTFNEELLFRHYMQTETDPAVQNWLLCNRASDILATLYRQTMFAEFEKKTHELSESGTPLTVDTLRGTYRELLTAYFGPDMVFEAESDLEGLRIPHFYNAFYVYKYATGVSAALALAQQVLEGGKKEQEQYFAFLSSGGSRYPIESLKRAGVDMSQSEPVERAVGYFAQLVSKLEQSLF